MAVFLLKAKHGSSYVAPACIATIFADVPCSNPFSPWINELYNEGIAAGCGGGNFCPANPVSRAAMAVFIVTTFALP